MTDTAPNTELNRLSFWAQPPAEREAAFTWLRHHQPVSWQDKPDPVAPELPSEAGFWSLVKHDDIRHVSRNPQLFTSSEGIFVDDIPALETILSFIVMDQPRHTALRGIVNSTFTPRNVRKMEDQIRATVRQIIDEVAPKGEGDLCQHITKEVPGRVFAGFFGVDDPQTRQAIMDAAEQLGSWSTPSTPTSARRSRCSKTPPPDCRRPARRWPSSGARNRAMTC